MIFLSRFFKIHYWPALVCIWFIVSFILTYIISVQNGHVYPYFPYISDTGTMSPESCIFSELLNIGAGLMGVLAYIRYRQIDFAITTEKIPIKKIWNILGTISGFICCLGITIAGNFQETVLLLVHLLGAGMIFGNGTLYLSIQTKLTYSLRHAYRDNPNYWISPKMFHFRLLLTIIFGSLYTCVIIFGFISLLKFEEDITKITWWTENHQGYKEHLVSTIAEWIMVGVFLIYLYTYTAEFKSLEYKGIKFEIKSVTKSIENGEQTS